MSRGGLMVVAALVLLGGAAAADAPQDDAQAADAAPGEERGEPLVLMAGGDVMFGRYFKKAYRSSGGADPFQHLAPMFQRADLGIVNLETPLMDGLPERFARGRWGTRNLTFRADTRYAQIMKDAGINLVALANNHAEDCRDPGIEATGHALDVAGIRHAGTASDGDAYEHAILRVRGTEVVFLAVTLLRNMGDMAPDRVPRVAYLEPRQAASALSARVRALREQHPRALVLVSIHWGTEYSPRPYRAQRTIARATIDAGADVVLGHHPHVLQPVEAYGGGLILYSMGNLVFDMVREDARRTALFEIHIQPGPDRPRVARLILHPMRIPGARGGARPASAAVADAVLRELEHGSRRHHRTILRRDGGRLSWQPAPPE